MFRGRVHEKVGRAGGRAARAALKLAANNREEEYIKSSVVRRRWRRRRQRRRPRGGARKRLLSARWNFIRRWSKLLSRPESARPCRRGGGPSERRRSARTGPIVSGPSSSGRTRRLVQCQRSGPPTSRARLLLAGADCVLLLLPALCLGLESRVCLLCLAQASNSAPASGRPSNCACVSLAATWRPPKSLEPTFVEARARDGAT